MAVLIVRHAQSEANVDDALAKSKADHKIGLTPKGFEEADALGRFLDNYLDIINPEKSPVRLWASPYLRTTQTAQAVYNNTPHVNWNMSERGTHIFFDDRLREREFGYFSGFTDEENAERYPKEWEFYQSVFAQQGRYYARPHGGESGADVSDRLRTFKETLWRDIAIGYKHHVIVTHGFTTRCFVTSFLNLHPDIFENEKNPNNTAVRMLDYDPLIKRYADYGYIYDPVKNIALGEHPHVPVTHQPVFV